MKIKLVTVGKLKEKYLKDGIAEYSKRISRFAAVEMIELADEKTPDRVLFTSYSQMKKVKNTINSQIFNNYPQIVENLSFLS